MIARKCDRCGVCFDPFEENDWMVEFKNPIFRTSKNLMDHTIGQKMMPDESPDAYVDLCPKCTEAFLAFMQRDDISSTRTADIRKEESIDEKIGINIECVAGDILHRIGEFVADTLGGVGRRIRNADDGPRDSKGSERESGADEKSDD